MEKRRSILRLPAIWFPLFGHVHIRGYPPPDYVGTLRLLLEHGARPDARDICGKTFVHYASGPLCIDAMVFEMMDTVIEASKKTDRVRSWRTTRYIVHATTFFMHLPSFLSPASTGTYGNFPHSSHNNEGKLYKEYGEPLTASNTDRSHGPRPHTLTRLLCAPGGAAGNTSRGPTGPIRGGMLALSDNIFYSHTYSRTH